VKYTGNVVQSVATANGTGIGTTGAGDFRRVLFDENGWLWFAIGGRLYRNVIDWREGYMLASTEDWREESVDLGSTVTHLVQVGDSIYAGTVVGVYRVAKDMTAYLAYTAVGGGGGGRLNAPPAGELIPGTSSQIASLQGFRLTLNTTDIGYLVIGTSMTGDKDGGAVV